MLSRDRGAEISFGIDAHRRGLICRAEPMCRRIFQVGETRESMVVEAGLRDHHEEFDHGYHHIIPTPARTWGYGDKISRDGRSTLEKKPNHHGPLERLRVPR